jgi:hypothetical protein
MPVIYDKKNVFYYYHPLFIRNIKTFVCTIFYKTSIDFYRNNLENGIYDCNLEKSGYLESVFCKKLAGLNKTSISVDFPHFSGIAGTTGKGIANRFFKMRTMFSRCRLLCYVFNE